MIGDIARWPNGARFGPRRGLGVIDASTGSVHAFRPMSSISVSSGDVIIFDQRLLHGTSILPGKLRRLIALGFLPGDDWIGTRLGVSSMPRKLISGIRTCDVARILAGKSDQEIWHTTFSLASLVAESKGNGRQLRYDPRPIELGIKGDGLVNAYVYNRLSYDQIAFLKSAFLKDNLDLSLRILTGRY